MSDVRLFNETAFPSYYTLLVNNPYSHKTKNIAVLTLPQDAGAIRLLFPQGITKVRSFLTFLLLLWSTTLWTNCCF
jgi:hypothetical protein